MSPLNILLVVLVAVAVWAVVELALTIRKTRASVEEVTRTANETIEQVQPIIAKIDGAVDDIQPSIKQVDPMVDQANAALGEANESLRKLNVILGDVSAVSGTAAGAADVVNQVTNAAADAANGLVSKITGVRSGSPSTLSEGGDAPAAIEAPRPKHAATSEGPGSGYVTYGEAKADPKADDADAGVPGDAGHTDEASE